LQFAIGSFLLGELVAQSMTVIKSKSFEYDKQQKS